MKHRMVLAAAVLLTIGFFAGSSAQQPIPKDPNLHFFQQKFTMPLFGQATLRLPRNDCPVRIEAAITNIVVSSSRHPMMPAQPIMMEAVFVYDSVTQMRGDEFGSDGTDDESPLFFQLISLNNGFVTIRMFESANSHHVAQGPFNVCVNYWF